MHYWLAVKEAKGICKLVILGDRVHLKKMIKYAVVLFCFCFGCSKQTLDPALYPADWPLLKITALEGSKPTSVPKGWAKEYADSVKFQEHSYSSPDKSIMKSCGISFENPAGWQAVFDDINTKCSASGFDFIQKNHSPDSKKFINSAMWAKRGDSVLLFETSANKFILEVTHMDFPFDDLGLGGK